MEVMPACTDCGTNLNPENASKLASGAYKHIGCAGPKPAATPTPTPAVPSATPAPVVVPPSKSATVTITLDPPVSAVPTVADFVAALPASVIVPDYARRLAKALRAAADALESP
jgi:hypothetical protein